MAEEERTFGTAKKVFVLCFDGTGNKFSGTDSDSNILKIYRLLDRSRGDQFHYYQPGIGTYVTTASLEHTSAVARFKSWYAKAKDSAVGTSFANHVMAGYRFLMRYYSPEDDIYFFGFSRGAYTARFLAEMLDHVGLLNAGNEELQKFAWKAFSRWQGRRGGNSPEDTAKELEMYTYMKNFRETFSRPVRRIRFLGLFDTVNSVPRFESALMQRSRFPYTARSSAKVIRHAVSINERRAKFRQDLLTGSKTETNEGDKPVMHRYQSDWPPSEEVPQLNGNQGHQTSKPNEHETSQKPPSVPVINLPQSDDDLENPTSEVDEKSQLSGNMPDNHSQLSAPARPGQERRSSYTVPMMSPSVEALHKDAGVTNRSHSRRRYSDIARSQDILELWFPGGHADIGGGWPKSEKEVWALSHSPLVWMVHEAEKAGLKFDPYKMQKLNCCPDKIDSYGKRDMAHEKNFKSALHQSCTEGFIHDCLEFGGGLPRLSVLSWKIMEYLPFRRMDLQANGSWNAIRWPLPAGETRDIPGDAGFTIARSSRMQHDESYRPGNLILLGRGGRGMKVAPKHHGIGDWEVAMNEGDLVREYYMWKGEKDKLPNNDKNKVPAVA